MIATRVEKTEIKTTFLIELDQKRWNLSLVAVRKFCSLLSLVEDEVWLLGLARTWLAILRPQNCLDRHIENIVEVTHHLVANLHEHIE